MRKKRIKNPRIRILKAAKEKEDLFICAMGFEDRSLGSNIHLHKKNYRFKTALVLRYDVYLNENEAKSKEFEKTIGKMCDRYFYVKYYTTNRQSFASEFNAAIRRNRISYRSITINISSLTTHALVWIVNFALNYAEQIRIVYTAPTAYTAPFEEERSFASGVKEIFSAPEFSGAHLPGYSSLLIISLGYDIVRSRGIYAQVQPSKKIGIMAQPTTNKMTRLFPKMKKEHRRNFEKDDRIITLPLFDYGGLIRKLTEIRDQYIETSNISIALNGPKIHAISALLFARKFKDIQLIFSTPIEYFPRRYSEGVGKSYELILNKSFIDSFMK